MKKDYMRIRVVNYCLSHGYRLVLHERGVFALYDTTSEEWHYFPSLSSLYNTIFLNGGFLSVSFSDEWTDIMPS